jgi:predicted nucleic acid-binding protein
MILVDTCVLTRLADLDSADRSAARRTVLALRKTGENLVIVSQNLCEFWAVASRKPGRPALGGENGLGMGPAAIQQWIAWYKRLCTLLPESTDVHSAWEALASQYQPKGAGVFDLRLVAFMQVYKIDRLLTLNTKHFQKYSISLLDPRTFATSPANAP